MTRSAEAPTAFVRDHEMFADLKPRGHAFGNDTQNMTGAEVFAMIAPQPETDR